MGRTALVTGGTGGLGTAVIRAFLDDGWRVVVPWIVEQELERVQPRDRLELVKADLFDPESARGAAALANAESDSPLRAVVNLVGGFSQPGRVHEAPIEDFEAQLRLNLRPTYLVCHAALPALMANGGGAIVCVGTRTVFRPSKGSSGYIAAKAGVLAFVRALDEEYRDDGIRANAVVPSIIDTEANRRAMPRADFSKWVPPEDIAKVILFLCSDDSKPTSGAWVPVYGRA